MTVRLLSQEDRFLGRYLVPAKLTAFNSGVQDKLYETYKTDLSEKRDFDTEILRWQTNWSHSTDKKPVTLTETVHSSTLIRTFIPTWSQLLPSSWQCPAFSAATPERSFSTMRRVKTYLLSTMKTERLAALVLMHAYRDIPTDLEAMIHEFCANYSGTRFCPLKIKIQYSMPGGFRLNHFATEKWLNLLQ